MHRPSDVSAVQWHSSLCPFSNSEFTRKAVISSSPTGVMELAFDCECGEKISEFTRAKDGGIPGVRIPCPECGTRYVVTITRIGGGES